MAVSHDVALESGVFGAYRACFSHVIDVFFSFFLFIYLLLFSLYLLCRKNPLLTRRASSPRWNCMKLSALLAMALHTLCTTRHTYDFEINLRSPKTK